MIIFSSTKHFPLLPEHFYCFSFKFLWFIVLVWVYVIIHKRVKYFIESVGSGWQRMSILAHEPSMCSWGNDSISFNVHCICIFNVTIFVRASAAKGKERGHICLILRSISPVTMPDNAFPRVDFETNELRCRFDPLDVRMRIALGQRDLSYQLINGKHPQFRPISAESLIN